jgi:predicted PurR-regulated permease PerM
MSQPAPANTTEPALGQRVAQYILFATLLLLGAWTLHRFIAALAWAVILAVATWPLYDRWSQRLNRRTDQVIPALTFTVIVGLVLMVPMVWGTIVAWRQAVVLLRHFAETPSHPLPLPDWLTQTPWIGDWLKELWSEYFAQPGGTRVMNTTNIPVMDWMRTVGGQLVKRVAIFGFTLMSVFFVYLHGIRLAADVRRVSQRLFGDAVQPLLSHAVVAIRATVDGIVLVAVAEGAIMSGVYAFCGVSHPILFGFITGILAMVPFAAPIAFVAVAGSLAFQGNLTAAIVVIVIGATLLYIVDHFIRPFIIGDAARLPFLWVLLGILGGVESFGLIGLFIGPTLMAVLCSLWRDWAQLSEAKLATRSE